MAGPSTPARASGPPTVPGAGNAPLPTPDAESEPGAHPLPFTAAEAAAGESGPMGDPAPVAEPDSGPDPVPPLAATDAFGAGMSGLTSTRPSPRASAGMINVQPGRIRLSSVSFDPSGCSRPLLSSNTSR